MNTQTPYAVFIDMLGKIERGDIASTAPPPMPETKAFNPPSNPSE